MNNYNRPSNISTDTYGRTYRRRDEFVGNDNVELLQYEDYGANYPIGDSQEVKRETEYMTNKEYQQCIANSNLYKRTNTNVSAIRSKLNSSDLRAQQGYYQQVRYVPLMPGPKRIPQGLSRNYRHCTNERGDYGHTIVETNKSPYENNDHQFSAPPCQHAMTALSRERSNILKQQFSKMTEKFGSRMSEFRGKNKISDDEVNEQETKIKNLSTKKLQEVFSRNNQLDERKRLEEQSIDVRNTCLRNMHEICNRRREKIKQKLISNENVTNRTIPNAVETKYEPTDNSKLQPRVLSKDKYPPSFSYELAGGKSLLATTNRKQNVENDSLENDSQDKSKGNGNETVNNEITISDDETSLSQITQNAKDRDNEEIYYTSDNCDTLKIPKPKPRAKTRSVRSYRSNASSRSRIRDILKLNDSKCCFLSAINDGQRKTEQHVKSDDASSSELKLLQNDEKLNKDDCKLPVKQSQLIQVDSPSSEEKFCSDIMKSEIMSKMFKSVRDYHLKNIVQEVERLKYLDKLPEELVERKT